VFGRATITLGIGPHSSYYYNDSSISNSSSNNSNNEDDDDDDDPRNDCDADSVVALSL